MNWLPTETTTSPAVEPITREEAKLYAKIDLSDDDALIENAIVSARRWIERYTGLRLISQTIVMRTRKLYGCVVPLPCAPLQSITSIAYLDSSGAQQTLSPALYREQLFGRAPQIERNPTASWPEAYSVADAVSVTAIAGYGAATSDLPGEILHAMRILVAHFYDNRDGAEPPPAIGMLLDDFRTFWAIG